MKYSLIRFLGSFLLSAALLVSGNLSLIAATSDDGSIFEDKANSAVWEVIGPAGGDVRSVAIDPKDKDRLYISTLDGQIHTSADAGKSWRLLVNLNEPLLIIDNLLVDRSDSKRIYASGNRGMESGGFFYSKDAGQTWKEAKDLRQQSIHSLTQAAYDPKVIFVGTLTGIWRSANSGEDWQEIRFGTICGTAGAFAAAAAAALR